jgi:hypothetical protein
MSLESISEHAEAAERRDYIARWFPSGIKLDDQSYSFGQTELAVIEETLRCIERGDSLLIHDPIPSNRIPIGIILAYVRTQDPRFPSQGIVGQGQSLLAFPALHHGYVSDLDDFREDGIGCCPRLLDRQPIDRLSQSESSADLHTAKNNFEFDQAHPGSTTGVVFVDLRKPEWGKLTRRFDAILSLFEESNHSFVFYADETTPATDTLTDQLSSLTVTGELLTTAERTTLPDNPSLTTQFEQLVNSEEITVEQLVVGDPKMYDIVSDLSTMRDDIQGDPDVQPVVKMEVGWLFNLLTRLPVKPEYWDAVVADNYYQQGVRELLENLQGKAQRLDGRTGNILINYCEAANALHGHLNTQHSVQERLFQLITTSAGTELDRERIVVVKNDFERKAILRALTLENKELADKLAIRTTGDIDPTPGGEIIITRPLDADSYLYDFPTAERIAFLHFEPWAPLVEDRLEAGMGQLGVTLRRDEIGTTGGYAAQASNANRSTTGYERPENSGDADPTESLRADFEGEDTSSTANTGGGNNTQSRDTDLELSLSNGEHKQLSNQARVSVLKDNGDIARKQAKDLSVGDTLLLLDAVSDDIYDLFVESAHQKEKLRQAESVVERWRSILQDRLEDDWTGIELLAAIRERGSEIKDQATISNWRTGEAIGPRDPQDVRRILAILNPEMEPTYEATAEAMKKIRVEHRNIGRRARRAIESQVGGGIGSDLNTDLPEDVDQFSQDVREATIESITHLTNE